MEKNNTIEVITSNMDMIIKGIRSWSNYRYVLLLKYLGDFSILPATHRKYAPFLSAYTSNCAQSILITSTQRFTIHMNILFLLKYKYWSI